MLLIQHPEKKWETRPLDCWAKAKELRDGFYRDFEQAHEKGGIRCIGSAWALDAVTMGLDVFLLMFRINPDVALKERQVHETCYHTSLKTHGWCKLRNSPNVKSSFRVNIAVSCFKNSYFPKLSQDFLQHRG